MSERRITRRSATDLRKGKTDWKRLRSLTDEEIDAAIRRDLDSDPANFDWSKAELVMPRRKEAISIRLDEDVLAFFKTLGSGYQTRINAVLRHFMQRLQEAKRK
ncbi:BrnA antitoxin family protein [Methyloceanibacter sp.]|uniref:BrnA antitoxin family protein n=1 Tax=Methyloceanibacter sp. TaxID=1965321 RepID=UPI003D6D2D76